MYKKLTERSSRKLIDAIFDRCQDHGLFPDLCLFLERVRGEEKLVVSVSVSVLVLGNFLDLFRFVDHLHEVLSYHLLAWRTPFVATTFPFLIKFTKRSRIKLNANRNYSFFESHTESMRS